jgi:ABC-type transport system involved in cytochrome c biogenesis permease subunit
MMHKSVYKKYKKYLAFLLTAFLIFPFAFIFEGHYIYELACEKDFFKMTIVIIVAVMTFIAYGFFILGASMSLAEEWAEDR